MDPQRWKQIDSILDAALDLPEGERVEFVNARTPDDAELRADVLRLLAAGKPSEDFMNRPAMRVAASAIAADEHHSTRFRFVGQTVGTYRIEKLLGAGGMGEVYLALDEKLHRRVALKVLPPEFISNDERVKRFEQEARAISQLNHPNIVTVYDVGVFEGVNYIATEYVDGRNLRDLMGREFKLRNILLNSIQICDALSAAHRAGIIHRDIKPENIMIRRDGYAKILDFGLAKLSDPEGAGGFDPAKTTRGMLIGTPAYMSPEQICGDPVDHRTDLWSCGVVLYEFLTGQNPFRRPTRQATLQAIVKDQPPPARTLNADLPEELERILIKALEKDPDISYQSAADFRADLKRALREIDSAPSWSYSGGSGNAERSGRHFAWWTSIAGSLLAVLVAAAFGSWLFIGGADRKETRSDWSRATKTQLTFAAGTEFFPSLAPDGRSFVYAAREGDDWDIFLQRVGGKNAQNLTADSDGNDTQPAFSPDGELIAFRSGREPAGIYIMESTGENPRRVADFGFHPSWSPDGQELAISTANRDLPDTRNTRPSEIWIINIASGERRLLTSADAMQPAWSPDGRFIAYWFMPAAGGRRDVAIIPADGGEPTVVTRDGTTNWNPVWSPDGRHLYFASDMSGNMTFCRIEIGPGGLPASAPEIVVTPAKYSRHLTFSRDGRRMIFVSTDNRSNIQAVRVNKDSLRPEGEPFWVTTGDRQVSRPDLSPDGSRFVLRLPRRNQEDIITISVDGTGQQDVTDDPAFDRYPRWSPDGKQIAFTSDRDGTYEIHVVNADGTGRRRVTEGSDEATFPLWSPDGSKILYRANRRLFVVDIGTAASARASVREAEETGSRFVAWDWSADGDKLAGTFSGSPMRAGYYSFTDDKFVPLAPTSQYPRWFPDGSRILIATGKTISAVDIRTGKVTDILAPRGDITSLGVSDDGTLVYYVIAEEESDLWLLELPPEK